jgi:hypothetical protein
MSRGKPNSRKSAGQAPGDAPRPQPGAGSIRSMSLLLLLFVNLVVAVQMVLSFLGFAFNPDPDVKAGAMYVALTLTTGSAQLMLMMAVNASYLPLVSREQAPNVYLIMAAMGVTGVVTGLLTVGGATTPFAARLVCSAPSR